MSYTLHAYAVDIDRLRAVFGSNDTALVAAVNADQAEEFKDNKKWFRDDIREGAPTLDAALEQIVAGTVSDDESAGFQYGYATEVLCRQLGKELVGDSIGWLSETGLESALLTSGSPMPFPRWKDFPEIGFLTATQVRDELAQLRDAEEGDEDPDARAELVGYLERAAELGVGLVTFTY